MILINEQGCLCFVLEQGNGFYVVSDGKELRTVTEDCFNKFRQVGVITQEFNQITNYKRFSKLERGRVVTYGDKKYIFTKISKYNKIVLSNVNDLTNTRSVYFDYDMDGIQELPEAESENILLEMFTRYDISKCGIRMEDKFTFEDFKQNLPLYLSRDIENLFETRGIIGDYRNVPMKIDAFGYDIAGLTGSIKALEYLEEDYPNVFFLRRCDETLLEIIRKLGLSEELMNKIKNNSEFRLAMPSVTDATLVAYFPTNKKLEWGQSENAKPTHTISIYKFLMRILKDDLTEYEIKELGDKYVALNAPCEVIEVDDDSIHAIYASTCDSSWNTSSCMREKDENFFDIYRENSAFKLMVIIKGDEIVGRFLKVTARDAYTDEEFTYMDRLYYKNETIRRFFYDWCKDNGYIRKENQSAGTRGYFQQGDKTFYKDIYLELDGGNDLDDYGYIPYLDTMSYSDGLSRLYNYTADDVVRIYDTTDGSYNDV